MLLTKLLLLLTVTIWGWTFVATKIMLNYVMPIELLGLRMIIGLPLLYSMILARRIKFDLSLSDHLNLLVGSAIITTHFFIQITGLKYTSATNTGWLIAITPLAMAILSRLILKEKIGGKVMIGIGVATSGVLLLVSHGDFAHLGWLKSVGDWLVLASAFTWALYTISTRDISRRKNPAVVALAVFVPTGILCLSYMCFKSDWGKFTSLPVDGVVALLFLAVMGTALAQWLWQAGVAKLGASKAGIFLYLEPVATTVLAVPYMGEPFGVATTVGGLLVLLGVYLAERK